MFIGYGFVMFCLKNRHYIYQRCIVSDRYVSKYIVFKEVNNVYDCLLKDEDLYNIYNKRAEQAIAKMRQEVGFSNDKIKESVFNCFE